MKKILTGCLTLLALMTIAKILIAEETTGMAMNQEANAEVMANAIMNEAGHDMDGMLKDQGGY